MVEATHNRYGYLQETQEIPLKFMGEKWSPVSFTEASAKTGQKG